MKRPSRRDQTGDHSISADGSNRAGVEGASSGSVVGAWSRKLRVAEQQDVIRKNGIAGREIREPPRHSDLVALKNPGITLDRLHERAGFALLGSAAFAKAAAAAQSCPELIDRPGGRRKIVCGIVVGVQGQVGFDTFEARDHARKRAHVLAETCNRGPRRDGPVPAARHDQLAAGAKLDRDRRPPGSRSFLRPQLGHCGRRRHVMLHDRRAQQVEADDVIAQWSVRNSVAIAFAISTAASWTPLCPKVFRARGETATQRACSAVEKRLDFPVAFHAIGKTSPTGALPGSEHRPHQGKNAGGLDEHPGRTVRQMLPVQFAKAFVEIIVHKRDRQVGGAFDNANAKLTQSGLELRCTLHVDRLNADTTILEISLAAAPAADRGSPNRRPLRRRKSAMPERHSGGRPAASGLRGLRRMENPAPAREQARESSFHLLLSRRPAHKRARHEERTSGPRNRGTRHRVAAHRR